jgi:hypothetical protein
MLSVIQIAIAVAAAVAAGAATPPTSPHLNAPPANGGFAAPPTSAEMAGDPNEMICKYYATTGSLMKHRACRTRSEWNQLSVDSRSALNDFTGAAFGCSGSCGVKGNGK